MQKVELLVNYLLLNMFNGNFPSNYIAQAISMIENHPAKNWDSILDLYLYEIDAWNTLTAEEKSVLAKEILEHLYNEL